MKTSGEFTIKPLFSVVIPTFNSHDFIEKTLRSVFNQIYKNFEIIITDDGSSDQTILKVESLFGERPDIAYTIVKNDHQGPGENRNSGAKKARGTYLAFLDSDDFWDENKLEVIAKTIDERRPDVICHSEMMLMSDSQVLLFHKDKFDDKAHPFISLIRNNPFSTSAMAIKLDVFNQAGGFDPMLPSAQDYDLWIRIALIEGVKIEFEKKSLGYYVVRDGSISSNAQKRLDCMLQIFNKYKGHIDQYSPHPLIEKVRFKGKAYSVASRQFFSTRQFGLAIVNMIKGQLLWPRIDWPLKAIRSLIKQTNSQ